MKPHIFMLFGEWRIAHCGIRTYRRLSPSGFIGLPLHPAREVRK